MNTKLMKMIDSCNTIDDYVELYSKLEEMEELGQATSAELKYVEDRIGLLAGIQGATVERTLILKGELDNAKELLSECKSVDDFLDAKKEMEARSYTNEVIEKALEYGSTLIKERMPDEVEVYNEYVDTNPVGIKGLIYCFILSIVLIAVAIIVIPVILSDLDIWFSVLFIDLEITAGFVKNAILIFAVLLLIGTFMAIPKEIKCKKNKSIYEKMSKLGAKGYRFRTKK